MLIDIGGKIHRCVKLTRQNQVFGKKIPKKEMKEKEKKERNERKKKNAHVYHHKSSHYNFGCGAEITKIFPLSRALYSDSGPSSF